MSITGCDNRALSQLERYSLSSSVNDYNQGVGYSGGLCDLVVYRRIWLGKDIIIVSSVLINIRVILRQIQPLQIPEFSKEMCFIRLYVRSNMQ